MRPPARTRGSAPRSRPGDGRAAGGVGGTGSWRERTKSLERQRAERGGVRLRRRGGAGPAAPPRRGLCRHRAGQRLAAGPERAAARRARAEGRDSARVDDHEHRGAVGVRPAPPAGRAHRRTGRRGGPLQSAQLRPQVPGHAPPLRPTQPARGRALSSAAGQRHCTSRGGRREFEKVAARRWEGGGEPA